MEASTTVRVRYQETDQMGVVYHGNYLTWFEVARTDLIRKMGMAYADLETKGILIPVIEVNCKYLFPAKYDQEVMITTRVEQLSPIRISFVYQVDYQARRLAEGRTQHTFIDESGKLIRLDRTHPEIWQQLKSLVRAS